ncbi:MAG TPA: RiPP maturation radical SAM C-methyltransferase [Thermoanaerobaculia bacterium]|jgi:magnesium-protoporphyrin IX monomethyl ester (oxidative) cyclase
MLKIVLLNLPFAAYHLPSIGMTQIKSVVDRRFPGEVDLQLAYANMDVAGWIGLDLYERIGSSGEHLQSGFPEWFFREAAFPELPDNTEEYFARYYPGHDEAALRFRRTILEKRRGVGAVLDGIIDRYGLDRAGVVGFTSMFFENSVAFALARKVKERNPAAITVLGGATSESPSGEEFIRHVEALDFVFSGPGLESFPRFVDNLLRGEADANHRIPGVFSRRNQGREVGPMGEELDINLPIELDYGPFVQALAEKFPDWDVKAVLPFETSRGCWWGERSHCTFCGLNKTTMGYRAMRPDLAVELIRSLFRYADRASVLMCVDNILQRGYVKEVFPYLDTPPGLPIFYQLKANLNDGEVEAMSRAGVKLITPGFESLSTATLKLMEKGVTAFHNIQVMKYCALHDVHPGWNILVGSPGEQEETYAKYVRDLPLLVHLPAPQGLFSIHFNRYSPYFTRAADFGLDLTPLDYYAMVYPFPPEAIANVAYDFADANLDAEYLLALAKWIDPVREKVQAWQRRWREEDDGLPPRLFFAERQGEAWIHDSRSGEAREYPVSPAVHRLLTHLDEPRLVSSLASDLTHVDGLDLDRDLAFVRERGLVFPEGEKLMSLVLRREPPPMTYRARALGVRKTLRTALEPAMAPIARVARRAVKPGAGRVGA